MRIWHEDLIPKLCQKHLCAMWREGLGCYNIVTSDKKGYRNHPATKEFLGHASYLFHVLRKIRSEMLERGYHPRDLPKYTEQHSCTDYKPWQTLEEQIEVIKTKGCKCKV